MLMMAVQSAGRDVGVMSVEQSGVETMIRGAGFIRSVADVEVGLIAPHFFGTSVLEDDHSGVYNDIVIPKGEKLPCLVEKVYAVPNDNQTNVQCDVTQSAINERNLEFVTKIWEGGLALPPGRPAGQPIKVIYAYDINGTMQCSFEDVKTGKVTKVDLKPGN